MTNRPINIRFVKMTGAGNDFILVDNRAGQYSVEWAKFALAACNRRYGVGADGLLIIAGSESADFSMLYYNADGSYGGMCGNGGRCAAHFVLESAGKSALSFHALDYIYHASRNSSTSGDDIRLEMKDPSRIQINKILHLDGSVLPYHFVDTGSPHAVLFMDEMPHALADQVRASGIEPLGRKIRHHRLFASDGTNVNFIDASELPLVKMRTYERGVEAETLACGTGSVACAVVAHLHRQVDPPITILTRGGETLEIDFNCRGGSITRVSLTGPAKPVFWGELQYDNIRGSVAVVSSRA